MNYKKNKLFPILPLLILILFAGGVTYLYINTAAIILLLIALPGVFAYWLWYKTFYNSSPGYLSVLPIYLATVAGFMLHAIEEYLGRYSLAISRIFNFPWTEDVFVIVLPGLCGILVLVAIGLYFKNPIAAFVATLFVITRFAELALFVFPLLQPSIQPNDAGLVSEIIMEIQVNNMPGYFTNVSGRYYFPGMYSVLLPLIPAVFYVKKLLLLKPFSK